MASKTKSTPVCGTAGGWVPVTGVLGRGNGWLVTQGVPGNPHVIRVVDLETGQPAMYAKTTAMKNKPGDRTAYVSLSWSAVPADGRLADALRDRVPRGPKAKLLRAHALVVALVQGANLRDLDVAGGDVHHINFDGLDNRSSNLLQLPGAVHDRLHEIWPPRDPGHLAEAKGILRRHGGKGWRAALGNMPCPKPLGFPLFNETIIDIHPCLATESGAPGGGRGAGASEPPGRPGRGGLATAPVTLAIPRPLTLEAVKALASPAHQAGLVLSAARALAPFGAAGATAKEFERALAAELSCSGRTAQRAMPIAVGCSGGLIAKEGQAERASRDVRYRLVTQALAGP